MDEKNSASAPKPRFVGPGAPKAYRLRYPIEFDGKVYEEIVITPPTTATYVAYMDDLAAGKPGDLKMVDAPDAVLDYLHPDDTEEVNKVIVGFLPRALKEAAERVETPGDTSESSEQNSDSPSPNSNDSPGPESSGSTNSPESAAP